MSCLRDFDRLIEVTEHNPEAGRAPHRHRAAYAAIVLEGAYREWSADGAVAAAAGDIVLHPPFHEHFNTFQHKHVRILNIRLPFEPACAVEYGVVGGAEADEICAIAVNDPVEAANTVLGIARRMRRKRANHSKQDQLNRAAILLREARAISVMEVARRVDLSAAYLSRAFSERFGYAPAAYRAEHRFRRALAALRAASPLADAAQTAGYADQAHMTRDFRVRIGATPAVLRREVKSVQDGRAFRHQP